jgi:hypothetical protein
MNGLLVLTIICLIGVVFALARGVFAMSHGGELDDQVSERMMVARLKWQAMAVVLLIVGYYLSI